MKNIVLFLFLVTSLYSQQKFITAKVINQETYMPVSDVIIRNESFQVLGTTDTEGNFSLNLNTVVAEFLNLSIIGYESKQIKVSDLIVKQTPLYIAMVPKLISSQTILVSAAIGGALSPISYSKINKETIKNEFTLQDIPEYLNTVPSVTFYSESGNSIGYSYLNIRGFDQRRISVAINGIPQNDPEDHNVYWVDFPDILENTDLIQVQRGGGSGIIGYPSIGGSVNILTSNFTSDPFVSLKTVLGSFNSSKLSLSFSSGLIDNSYSIYGRVSKIKSDGYRNSSWSDFTSFFLSLKKDFGSISSQFNFYGGPIKDGLVYNGLPKFAIKDKVLRKENLSYWEAEGKEYTYKSVRRNQEQEYFSQPHFELLNSYKINDFINFNSCLFYVNGEGYYDYDGSWADTTYFRITNENGFSPANNPENSLIRASVSNHQFGWMPRAHYSSEYFEFIFGAEFRFHNSLHTGKILFANNLPENYQPDFEYYSYKGQKEIINIFLHSKYLITNDLRFTAEFQASYFNYSLFEEKFLNTNFSVKKLFLNPKLGISYKFSEDISSFISFARISREPRLKNYYDAAESSGGEVPQFELNSDGSFNFEAPLVKPETMNNMEIGVQFSNNHLILSAGYYLMYFQNEIVKNGKLDRFGQPKTGNADETIHSGIELSSIYKPQDYLELNFNLTYSKNFIKKGVQYFKYQKSILAMNLDNNPVSGFPGLLINCAIKYTSDNFFAKLDIKYSGEFFSDNFGTNIYSILNEHPELLDYTDNKIEPYLITNFLLNYRIRNFLSIGIQVNNVFNVLYASNAFGKEFFPGAERNFNLSFKVDI